MRDIARHIATPSRRALLRGAALFALGGPALAQENGSFGAFLTRMRARAAARGISDQTWARATAGLSPDDGIFDLQRRQPEFTENVWQYLARRVTDWRVTTGRARAQEHADLLQRIEQRYGVDRFAILSVWGNESSFGEVIANPRFMRPVLRSLATLAWGEPRRRAYWEQEFLNALVLVERGWITPERMIGSWAGAMGHTQFMPEAWLNASVDFDGDGRRNLFEIPDALASTANFLSTRGRWQTGRPWMIEVRASEGFSAAAADNETVRSVAEWQRRGLSRADGRPFANTDWEARARFPMGTDGPGFLLFQNFRAFFAYNPSFNYALAVGHLADRIRGGGPFVQRFPGEQRALTLAETQEMQQLLTASGFDTGGTTGAVGDMTRRAIRAFQQARGMTPVDGWPSEAVLNRLRTGRA
jgi:lytic murein transglycosylase